MTNSYSKDLKTILNRTLARLVLASSGMLFSSTALSHPILDMVDMVDMAYCFSKAKSTKKLSHLIQMIETYHHPVPFTTPPQTIAQVIEHVTSRFAKPDHCFCMDTVQHPIERITLPAAESNMTPATQSGQNNPGIYAQAINQENLEKAVYFYKDGDEIVFGAAEESIIEKSAPQAAKLSKPDDTVPLNSQSILRMDYDNVIADTTLGKSISLISSSDRNAVDMMANMTRALASRYSDNTENWSDAITVGEMPLTLDFAVATPSENNHDTASLNLPQEYSTGALTLTLADPATTATPEIPKTSTDQAIIAEIQNGLDLVLSMLATPYCQAEHKIEAHDQPIMASKADIQNGLELALSMLQTPYCQPEQKLEALAQPIMAEKAEIQNGLELVLSMLDVPYCQTEQKIEIPDQPIVATKTEIQDGLELALSMLTVPYCEVDSITYAALTTEPETPTLAQYTDILDVPEINLSRADTNNYCDTVSIQS